MTDSEKKLAPGVWTFHAHAGPFDFEDHVRKHLPWYDLASEQLADIIAGYLPQGGAVLDVGAGTGNVERRIRPLLATRAARLVAVEPCGAMLDTWERGPNVEIHSCDAESFFHTTAYRMGEIPPFDVTVAFLSLSFMAPGTRGAVIRGMVSQTKATGICLVVDRFVPTCGYFDHVLARSVMAQKHRAGEALADIGGKEISLIGVQRPLDRYEFGRSDYTPFFQFGPFMGVALMQ